MYFQDIERIAKFKREEMEQEALHYRMAKNLKNNANKSFKAPKFLVVKETSKNLHCCVEC
ncbi:hypothetical protein [Litchfieldia alkalitelluris]|uniref:hypothetical protein n=1 Tax=Litchfieldia alkalitelluris TaxID=304268 RepID=UPI0009979B67|nr:hypothetical protein [Litchfieldia alkalitelluris]